MRLILVIVLQAEKMIYIYPNVVRICDIYHIYVCNIAIFFFVGTPPFPLLIPDGTSEELETDGWRFRCSRRRPASLSFSSEVSSYVCIQRSQEGTTLWRLDGRPTSARLLLTVDNCVLLILIKWHAALRVVRGKRERTIATGSMNTHTTY